VARKGILAIAIAGASCRRGCETMCASTPRSTQRQYDICLSFAGEQRSYVQKVAQILRDRGKKVFYDEYETVQLWGRDLVEYLDWVYRESADYCVLFASKEYAAKNWTTHERRSAQARALEQREVYLLPARFDDTEIPGLVPTTAYIDLKDMPPDQLGELIIQKLEQDSDGVGPSSRTIPPESRWSRPFWDPDTGDCRGIEGSPVISGQWQVAPRHLDGGRSVRPGQALQLGLRKKDGQQNEMYWVSATVFAPDGTSTQAEQFLRGDEWASVNYPADFAGSPSLYPLGAYTVLWEVAEGFLACDGFLVEDRTTFGGATTQADPKLEEFEAAWQNLRLVVQRAKADPEAVRSELVQAIDKAIMARTYSRETLAQMYGGYWTGDQHLFDAEVRVGALARELDNLVERWTMGERDLPAREILARIEPVIVTPGSEDHPP
jgi:hypothetical protein